MRRSLPSAIHGISLSTAIGVYMVVDLDIVDVSSLSSGLATIAASGGVGDVPGSKVGKLSSTTTKFDDPFSIRQAQGVLLVLERSSDLLTSSEVLQSGGTRVGGRGIDAHADVIASLDFEVTAVVDRRLRPPLVPGLDSAVSPGDDTRLENGTLAVGSCSSHC